MTAAIVALAISGGISARDLFFRGDPPHPHVLLIAVVLFWGIVWEFMT